MDASYIYRNQIVKAFSLNFQAVFSLRPQILSYENTHFPNLIPAMHAWLFLS